MLFYKEDREFIENNHDIKHLRFSRQRLLRKCRSQSGVSEKGNQTGPTDTRMAYWHPDDSIFPIVQDRDTARCDPSINDTKVEGARTLKALDNQAHFVRSTKDYDMYLPFKKYD